MTVLNRLLTFLAALFLTSIPSAVMAQENGESAEDYLRRAGVFHSNYEFAKAEEYYKKAYGLMTDSLEKLSVMDRILQCRNGESLLQYIARPASVTSQAFRTKDFYLYLRDLEDCSWIPVPNPFVRPAGGNVHPYYTAMYFPQGEQTVIYSAPDAEGAWNIYTSTRKDSTWSAPELLSPGFTSGHNEIFPILSRDGQTLYFASDGLPGMGGYDLFKSTMDPQTGEWGAPENLGFPYSSTGNDILYLDSRDGKYSIIVSDRETAGTDSVKIYVTEYIATPVRTPLGEDESPLAVASFINESAVSQARNPESSSSTATAADARMTDYSRLMHRLRRLQNEHRNKLTTIEENRTLYGQATGSDRESLAGIIRDVEAEAMQIRRQVDSLSAQVRQIEMRFLSEGIIPTVLEESQAGKETHDTDNDEYIFSRHTMGEIPYIILETPEPEFDYTFRILGRDEGQFVEDTSLPEGIVYQIQFSVLTSHAKVRDIRGMSPVFVTRMKSGKYLHAVGLFRTYREAAACLGRVRSNGFPEAFIIAYNNGSSVSVKNARAMESGGGRTSSGKSGETAYQLRFDGYGTSLPASVLTAVRGACTKDITKSGSGEETVFAVGPFESMDEAEEVLRILEDLDIENVKIETINI